MIIKSSRLRTYGAAIVTAALLIVDINYLISMSAAAEISYGRVLIGIVLQLASIALVATDLSGSRDGKANQKKNFVAAGLSVVVPTLVLGWMGISLFYSGIHEGGIPLKYRGNDTGAGPSISQPH